MAGKSKKYVREFVGEELWSEIKIRVAAGQKRGQALINAGEHADRVWAWETNWEAIMIIDDWQVIALMLKLWKEKPENKDFATDRLNIR